MPPPAGVVLAAPGAAAGRRAAIDAAQEGDLAPAKVARVLKPLLADPDLGKHVRRGRRRPVHAATDVFATGGRARPASTTKLLTATAALHVLGPEHRFTTRVVLEGKGKQRRLVLVGGGDPYLASKPATKDEPVYPHRADLRTLARQTASALAEQGVRRVRLAYDDSLFTGPDASPTWERELPPRRRGRPDQGALGGRGPPAVGIRPGAPTRRSPRRRTSPTSCAGPGSASRVSRETPPVTGTMTPVAEVDERTAVADRRARR